MTDVSHARRRVLGVLGAGALAALGYAGLRGTREERPDAVAAALRDGTHQAGFARVEGPRPFEFPRDHAAHPAYRHEWWYITGHLTDAASRDYGFQLTFFRYALLAEVATTPSRWRTRDLMLAHFAVTDVAGERFHHATRRARAALDLAGADAGRAKVWVGDWSLAWPAQDEEPWHLQATTDDTALDLTLRPEKPVVLQGDRGYSRKSAEPGNASLYYSLPRLDIDGELVLGARRVAVEGSAWLDREWGTSALGKDQRGWDWFALQFEDGREFTYYRLRTRDGRTDPHSRGLLVARDGSTVALLADDVQMTPLRWWRSPRTGLRYPLDWRVTSRRAALELTLRARLDHQEWPGELRYWEGQVAVSGADGVRGLGYLEMTGYA